MTTSPIPLGKMIDSTSDGPAPHEDLTIAEQLETMRVTDESRPGELCFSDTKGRTRWLSENHVNRFINDHGAEFPSNYLLAHGTDWHDIFFAGR
jgi:hypothetical protein